MAPSQNGMGMGFQRKQFPVLVPAVPGPPATPSTAAYLLLLLGDD